MDGPESDDGRQWKTWAIFVALTSVSVFVLFLSYARWWDRPVDWLVTFRRWSWFRVSVLWSIITVLYGLAFGREAKEPEGILAMYGVGFLFVILLTYPGLEELRLGSDEKGIYGLMALAVVHALGVLLIRKVWRSAPSE